MTDEPPGYAVRDLNAVHYGCWNCTHSSIGQAATIWCDKYARKVNGHGRCKDWIDHLGLKQF